MPINDKVDDTSRDQDPPKDDGQVDESQQFYQLGPNEVLNAVSQCGLEPDGHMIALNSYENRVYRIGLYDTGPIVIKFYRPARWSDEQIIEEHDFTRELVAEELPVLTPWVDDNGVSLFRFNEYRFSLYPCVGGRPPELDNSEHLTQLGRYLARLHNVGSRQRFNHRPAIDIDSYVIQSSRYLQEHQFLPRELEVVYTSIIDDLIRRIDAAFERAGQVRLLRLHGDCHQGNILWSDDTPNLLDFDDARMGPAMQDIWMFLSGDREYMTARLQDFLEGYCLFRDFDPRELHLLEALRSLRIIHYAAWLARRWHDPAFPIAFPYFNTQRYWEDHILSLREQTAALDEPPLECLV